MKKILLLLIVLAAVACTVLWLRYGGGESYPDQTTTARLGASGLETVLEFSEPIGNVAVNRDGRIFFTVHPAARSRGNKLLEYVDGAAVPYPDSASQQSLFDTPLGVVVDQQNRLWIIDNGNYGLGQPRLLGFDLDSGRLVHDKRFAATTAPAGSFLQDLQVSADGRTVVIADTSIWRKDPALIVYDIPTQVARRVLDDDQSVQLENYRIRNQSRELSFFGGMLSLKGGVDGIALGPQWLYYAALSGSWLYRVRLADLTDKALTQAQLAERVERYSRKPLSDGLSLDINGDVYVTDVEHNAVFMVTPDRQVMTLLRSPKIRWPDALSFGPDGWLYVADSALADVLLQRREQIAKEAPYFIYRFRPGSVGVAGQ